MLLQLKTDFGCRIPVQIIADLGHEIRATDQ